ncbi:MAG: ABC transporter ATP-binding protein [Desulfurococcales archaeon]|nr:ABC transporter ATP-binding protein [Desulfurococcales archaeon]MCE4605252.1 ABC transporter ATP-binding protein [Desulfurococcales archaeon]
MVNANDVWKTIKRKTILRGASLTVGEGQVYVLAGPNGAGKTTLIRILMGLISMDSGRIEVLGCKPGDPDWDKVKLDIGYLPEDASPYDRLTGWENLRFYAELYSQGDPSKVEEYLENAAAISGLTREELSRRAGGYSRGMKRRLLIAATLMHNPRLVVMDEPTSGLDVFAAYRVKRTIRSMAGKGYTFLITTHDMSEAQELATHIGFIESGRIIFQGTVEDALSAYSAESLEEAFVRAVGDGRS